LPEVRRCEDNGFPDGFYCGWPAVEAAERRANVTLGRPISPCSSYFYQCSGGITYALQVVPAGTVCYNDEIVNAPDPRCALAPASASATPGRPSPTASVTRTPSTTPGIAASSTPTLTSCLHLEDGFYCGSSAGEAADRLARAAANLTNSFCYDRYQQCLAGATYPLQGNPPGTVCWPGTTAGGAQFLLPSDVRCSGGSVATPSPVVQCPRDGLFCDEQCSRTFYQCAWGVRYPSQSTAAGTVCYDWGSGGYLIHENDLRCVQPGQWCAANETAVKCYDSATGNSTATACTSAFYHCRHGQPFFIQDVAQGTQCYAGGIVHSNDPVCRPVAPSPVPSPNAADLIGAPAVVLFQLRIAGLSADSALSPSGAGELRAVIATALGGNTTADHVFIVGSSDIGSAFLPGGDSGRRLDALPAGLLDRWGNPVSRNPAVMPGRGLQSSWFPSTSEDAPGTDDAWTPRAPPLSSVAIVAADSAAGHLGAGAAMVTVTVAATSAAAAPDLASRVQAISTPDSVTGVSKLTAAAAAAGLPFVIDSAGGASVPSVVTAAAVAAPTQQPGSGGGGALVGGQLSGNALIGTVVGSVVGGIAVVAVAVVLALNWRRITAPRIGRRAAPPPATGHARIIGTVQDPLYGMAYVVDDPRLGHVLVRPDDPHIAQLAADSGIVLHPDAAAVGVVTTQEAAAVLGPEGVSLQVPGTARSEASVVSGGSDATPSEAHGSHARRSRKRGGKKRRRSTATEPPVARDDDDLPVQGAPAAVAELDLPAPTTAAPSGRRAPRSSAVAPVSSLALPLPAPAPAPAPHAVVERYSPPPVDAVGRLRPTDSIDVDSGVFGGAGASGSRFATASPAAMRVPGNTASKPAHNGAGLSVAPGAAARSALRTVYADDGVDDAKF